MQSLGSNEFILILIMQNQPNKLYRLQTTYHRHSLSSQQHLSSTLYSHHLRTRPQQVYNSARKKAMNKNQSRKSSMSRPKYSLTSRNISLSGLPKVHQNRQQPTNYEQHSRNLSTSRQEDNRTSRNVSEVSYGSVNEALLTEDEGKEIDRREIICSNCIDSYPTNCIGLVLAQSTDLNIRGWAKGTVFMVGKRLALTAAHTFACVDGSRLIRLNPKKVYLGVKGELRIDKDRMVSQNELYRVEDFVINPKYLQVLSKIEKLETKIRDHRGKISLGELNKLKGQIFDLQVAGEEYDYALIKLNRDVRLSRVIKLAICGSRKNEQLKVQGYQTDPVSNLTWRFEQYFHAGMIYSETEHAFYYDADTKRQQSGSPVLVSINGEVRAIGIHKGFRLMDMKEINVGVKITSNLLENINQWAQDLQASFPELQSASKISGQNPQHIFPESAVRLHYESQIERLKQELQMKHREMLAAQKHAKRQEVQVKRLKQMIDCNQMSEPKNKGITVFPRKNRLKPAVVRKALRTEIQNSNFTAKYVPIQKGELNFESECLGQGCPAKQVKSYWLHHECNGRIVSNIKASQQRDLSDVYLKCSKCQIKVQLFSWMFKCEYHSTRRPQKRQIVKCTQTRAHSRNISK